MDKISVRHYTDCWLSAPYTHLLAILVHQDLTILLIPFPAFRISIFLKCLVLLDFPIVSSPVVSGGDFPNQPWAPSIESHPLNQYKVPAKD